MAAIYDLNTDRGKVRLLIPDTSLENNIFEDEEIDQFIEFGKVDGEVDHKLAAAFALETIASSEALIQKKIKLLDLQTDGPAVAKELRARAEKLRDLSEEEAGFEIAEMTLTNFSRRQLLINDMLENE